MRIISRANLASTADFVDTFLATTNPLTPSVYVNGSADGLLWQNCQSTPGKCFATGFAGGTSQGTEFDDDVCHVKTSFRAFANNQFVEGIVSRAVGYSPNTEHEIELYLRAAGTANNWRGYEILWAHTGECAVVRWNGPLANSTNSNNGFTELFAATQIGAAVENDALRGEIIGSVIKVYKNGSLVITVPSDTTWTSGQPGMGFWPRFFNPQQVVFDSYCWKQFKAGDL